MIWKWTRIIQLKLNFYKAKKWARRHYFKTFRKAVIFRKYHLKRTKFRRKQYAKLKHAYNWSFYVQIWQHWARTYTWHMYLIRFQLIKNFNEWELISYNSYFFNTKKTKIINNFSFFYNCYISRKMFFFFNKKNYKFNLFTNFFSKNIQFQHSYVLNNEDFKLLSTLTPSLNLSIHPIIFNLNNNFFNINYWDMSSKLKFNFLEILNLIDKLIYIYITEIKKLITLLIFFNIS